MSLKPRLPAWNDPGANVHWVLALLLTAVAYAVCGLAALRLAIPPGYASPLYPSAGIALASVLVFGWRMLPGVTAGSFIVNLTLGAQRGDLNAVALALPAAIAIAATLQALAGAVLVKRFVRQPLELIEPRDIALFFGFGALCASVVGACLSSAALALSGTVMREALPVTLLTWWVGDSLGVLIAAPIVLTLIGTARSTWASRRLTVGLPLTLLTLLVALGTLQVARWQQERLKAAFERDASNASAAMAEQLQDPLHALEALRGVFVASGQVSAQTMQLVTKPWLVDRKLQAMGWSERLRRDEVAAFETRIRAEGLPAYRVFDRSDATGASEAVHSDDVVAMRYVEPLQGNESALGVNALSVPAARAAIETATLTDRPAATAGFRLTQDAGDQHNGVVIYHALYHGMPRVASERKSALRGVVFVTLRLDALLRSLQDQVPGYLTVCIVDTGREPAKQRLAGAEGCETRSADLRHVRALAFAGRQWDVRVLAQAAQVPHADGGSAWLVSLAGLLAAGMLGALLLTMTGRTRRIEAAVRERTAALEAEVLEREAVESALRGSEQRLRNILNHIPIGVIYTDLRGHVQQTNPRFCELTGYSEEDLQLMTSQELTHPEDVAEDVDLSLQLVRGEIPMYRLHKRYVTADNRAVWAQATVTLLRDAQSQPQSIVSVVEDITEHLRLQEAENARELAEAANRAKSDFLSRMSHELRTPLNAMLGFAQLLALDKRHPLASQQQPWVAQIQQAGWHLLEMINDVLDLSRIESGNVRLQIEALALCEMVDATVTMVAAEAQRRSISISTELAAEASTVLGDATRVKQILTNLLSNAVKYNRDGGRVVVTARLRAPDRVEITVTDTGVGMTPEQMAQLFQPFNRLGRELSAQQGTGIGLVISQRLAELMGGLLRARSSSGQGSSFVLTLPRAVDPDTVRSELDSLALPEPGYHRRVVHYVEDNETNVEVMRGILAQRPQVELDVSVTGLDGLVAIRNRRPDLILLDMHLPDISGLELLRHLQTDPDTRSVPVVVVSADALDKQIEEAIEAGAARYLTKPISVAELLGVVDDLLDRIDTRFD